MSQITGSGHPQPNSCLRSLGVTEANKQYECVPMQGHKAPAWHQHRCRSAKFESGSADKPCICTGPRVQRLVSPLRPFECLELLSGSSRSAYEPKLRVIQQGHGLNAGASSNFRVQKLLCM